MIIAVDGPTASGKGTISRSLAKHYGLPHMDTGLLYRAVGRQVVLNGGNPDDEADALIACAFADSLLHDPILRMETTGGLASRVSIHPKVRAALNERQVSFAHQAGGALLDGRDIGTVIAPDADVKLFVSASLAARAQRRFAEMQACDNDISYEDILADLAARDTRDQNRATAPLKPAVDALLLDTSDLTIDAAVQLAITLVEDRIKSRSI